MRCRTAQRWITRELAGELTAVRAGRLAQHLERCEGCRHEQAAYAALDRALGQLPLAAALPARLEQDTLRRVRLAAADDPPGPRRAGRWIGVAVPALAAAGALVLAVQAPEAPPPAGRLAAAPAVKPGAATRAPVQDPRSQAAPRDPVPAPAARPAVRKRRTQPVVPSEPPPELAARPDLFINLPLLRNLEKLEHYDSIRTTTVDGHQGNQSNG